MECLVNDKRFDICVKKFPVKKAGKAKGKVCIDTICMIFSVTDLTKKGDDRRDSMLGQGRSHQSITDNYDKWLGKKHAFKRALDDAQPDRLRPIWEEHPANPEPSVVLTKQERTQLWSFFKDKFGGNKFKE